MKEKRKLKLKKFYLHPITIFMLLTLFTVILSGIFSVLGIQASYSTINSSNNQLENVLVTVENLFSYDGLKYIISNAARNFISFTTLSTLLISLIGVSIASASGLFDTFIKKYMAKMSNFQITFLLIFIATISSLINEVGYTILIPLGAILFKAVGRNPMAGVVAAFAGVAFGYGATVFVGSMEVNLISITTQAAYLVDTTTHVSLTSNLFIIIASSIILSIVGTFVMEKLIVPKIGRIHEKRDLATSEYSIIPVDEQSRLEQELLEKKGLRNALIAALIVAFIFIYSIIPGLPLSGMLLDMEETTYLGQLFGSNSYFQDGFTYMVSIFFMVTGLVYGFSSKTFKNDKDVAYKAGEYLSDIGSLIMTIFFAAQFIAIFRHTNIGTIITAWGANIISSVNFTGILLILLVLIVIAVVSLFSTTPVAKWTIMAPVVVPILMQSNISPQFAQFILRAGDSMTKGYTPLLAFFVIYVGYLNIYNPRKEKPITIGMALRWLTPYCLIIGLTWILITVGWYLIGLPIGPGVYPTV